MKLPIYKKKIKIGIKKGVKREIAKCIPDIGWWRKFNEFLAMIIRRAKI